MTLLNIFNFEHCAPWNWQLIIKECRIRLGWSLFSLIITWFSCYCCAPELVYIFTKPFVALYFKHSYHLNFLCSQVTEAFHTTMLIIVIASIYSFAPLIIYQIWCFCIPGCFYYQRTHINVYVCASFIWFTLIMHITFVYLLPYMGSFLYNFHQTSSTLLKLHLQPKMSDSIMLITKILIGVTFCSQMPMIIAYIISNQMIRISTCIQSRRLFFLLSVLIAAFFSPPDLVCQCLTTIAIIVQIEIAIIYGIFCYIYNLKASFKKR